MSISNCPPPVETHGMHINDLFDEAKNFLDGAGVKTEADATAVGSLLDQLRQARKAADEQRKVEKAPHDAAGKAVQVAWTPLLAKCDLAADAAKKALTPYLEAQEAAQRAAAQAARDEADRQAQVAQDALRATAGDDLAAREQAEALLKDARRADRDATRLDKARPLAATGGRSVGLRSTYVAEITDSTAFARWAWANRRAEYDQFLNDLAEREARATGAATTIPGILIHTERKAA